MVSDQARINSIEESNQPNEKGKKLNRRDYTLMATYAYFNIIIGVVYSCLAPFFPKEAEDKGISPPVYGFLFSLHEIISFLLCPVIGVFLPKLGLRPTLLVGSIISTIGVTCFGVLEWTPPGTTFAIYCGLIRGFGSLGMAMLTAGMYAAIPIFFPSHVSQVFGLLEMCYAIGMVCGPLFGGFLYEFGGFHMPFFISGGFMFITLPLIFYLCPESKATKKRVGKVGIFDILSNFRILVNALVTLVQCTITGFTQLALEPHLREFTNLSSSVVGIIFLVSGLFYGAATMVIGFILPKIKDATPVNVIGLILTGIAYIFIGPMYPIEIPPSVTLVILCQMLFGIGSSISLVSNFTQAIREKELSDMKDDPGAGSIISSIFVSMFSLGTGLGPIIAGQLIAVFTFSQTCDFIVGLVLATLLLVIFTILCHKRPVSTQNLNQIESARS